MTSRLGRLLGLDRRNRVRTPTILQMELTECGPRRSPSSSPISGDACRSRSCASPAVSRDGSKASSIVRAARRYGLDAEGHRLELDEVLAGPFPVIVHWGFNHFLVLEGVSDTSVFLNDPATGPRHVSREEFDRSFTGVGLRCARSGLQARRCVGRAAGPARPPPVGLPCRHRHHRLAEPDAGVRGWSCRARPRPSSTTSWSSASTAG